MTAHRRSLAGRATAKLWRIVSQGIERAVDSRSPTYSRAVPAARIGPFAGFLAVRGAPSSARELAPLYLEHRFDLLGSGWIRVEHGMRCAGLEGIRFAPDDRWRADAGGEWLSAVVTRPNLPHSRSAWRLIEGDYNPIDWQLDFVSGYRWSERAASTLIRPGTPRGADIKLPWELSRMQHLPQLALAFAETGDERFAREARNEMLDWIATNPPRFGVNWVSAMDVAIRAANWVVALDLLRVSGAALPSEIESVIAASLRDHGLHIASHLTPASQIRNNHYLSEVVGLIFMGAYAPPSRESDGWVRRGFAGLVESVRDQFNADGSNFEGSTCYHRLCAEMVLSATAVSLSLPAARKRAAGIPLQAQDFPEWYWPRLWRMGEFLADLQKPDGTIPQIGDNDSGRFLKLSPVVTRVRRDDAISEYLNLAAADRSRLPEFCPIENHLDDGGLPGAFAKLRGFVERHSAADSADSAVWGEVFESLSSRMTPPRTRSPRVVREEPLTNAEPARRILAAAAEVSCLRIPLPPGAADGLESFEYPDFGIFGWKGSSCYVVIRCGPIGQRGNGGHSHNDQLSIELSIAGQDVWRDPGTYLYTPVPERRDEYRSVNAHNGPHVAGQEPCEFRGGLFALQCGLAGRMLYFGSDEFIGELSDGRVELLRRLRFGQDYIEISDHSIGSDSALSPLAGLASGRREAPPFSPGYGIRLARH